MNCTPIVRHNLTIGGVVFFTTKFTSALKLAIVQGFNPNENSQKEYASQVCVTRSQFQFWLRLYELHGEEAFQNSYTNYPVPFKLNVLNYMVQSGASLMETAALFKISSYTMVYSWKKQMASGGLEALEPKSKGRPSMKKETKKQPKQQPAESSPEALQAEINRLRMENEYLKKLNALVQAKEKSPKKTK